MCEESIGELHQGELRGKNTHAHMGLKVKTASQDSSNPPSEPSQQAPQAQAQARAPRDTPVCGVGGIGSSQFPRIAALFQNRWSRCYPSHQSRTRCPAPAVDTLRKGVALILQETLTRSPGCRSSFSQCPPPPSISLSWTVIAQPHSWALSVSESKASLSL